MSTPQPLSTLDNSCEYVSPIPPNAFDFLPDLHLLLLRVYNDEIDAKDVGHESSRIRLKIQKARAMVAVLPEIDKSLEEQKEEIAELESRIAKQRDILKGVAELDVVNGNAGKSDTTMDVDT